ncbi:MAG: hypothetical protein LBI95_02435 [Holosporales bacterium]|jgi:NADH-quinone oxidoreductase subunit M|nr:hypothetical protein [Holosporales bacterium]
MLGFPTAFITTLSPLIWGGIIMGMKNCNISKKRIIAILGTLLTFCFSMVTAFLFNYSTDSFSEELHFFSDKIVECRIGIDVLSALFVPIISLISLVCVLWSDKVEWQGRGKNAYLISILIFEAFSIGSFYSLDIFLLFILTESTVIPIYVMMSQNREQSSNSSFYFLIYTMASALLVLTALILIYTETGTSNLIEIYEIGVENKATFWLLLIGIGIKIPIWPFYHWLPIVHVRSRTVCSVLLAAIVLKFATLFIIRFVDPLFSNLLLENRDCILGIVLVTLIFSTFRLIFQNDLKQLFAYFSINHVNMALPLLMTKNGKGGFVFSMMQHSIQITILFFVSDIIEKSCNTRSIKTLKTAIHKYDKNKKLILPAFLCLISIPFSWGFISEIMEFWAISTISLAHTFIFAATVMFSSLYAIHVYNGCFGHWKMIDTIDIEGSYALNTHKKLILFVLFGIILLIGVYPKTILNCFESEDKFYQSGNN